MNSILWSQRGLMNIWWRWTNRMLVWKVKREGWGKILINSMKI